MSNQIDNLSSIIAATKRSSSELGQASIEMRNNWLVAIKRSLLASIPEILSANEIDIEVALKQGLSKALIDRLTLNQSRLQQIVQSIEDIIAEKDPLNVVIKSWEVENGLIISKKSVPLGVIGIIYEARPNVTYDAICIGIKTGNAVVLRGGSDAFETNKKIVEVIKKRIE